MIAAYRAARQDGCSRRTALAWARWWRRHRRALSGFRGWEGTDG